MDNKKNITTVLHAKMMCGIALEVLVFDQSSLTCQHNLSLASTLVKGKNHAHAHI